MEVTQLKEKQKEDEFFCLYDSNVQILIYKSGGKSCHDSKGGMYLFKLFDI